jgi:hypothetical protein
VCLRDEVNDSIVWKWTLSDEFSTASAYSIQFQGSHPPFYSGKLEKVKAEQKVKFFGWTAMHQKIPTADILEIRGIQNNHFSYLCIVQAENTTHPLIECPFFLGSVATNLGMVQSACQPRACSWHPWNCGLALFHGCQNGGWTSEAFYGNTSV